MILFLKKPVFNHGQLCVAASRVSNTNGLKILVLDENEFFFYFDDNCCLQKNI